MIIKRNIIDVFIIEMSFYQSVLLSKSLQKHLITKVPLKARNLGAPWLTNPNLNGTFIDGLKAQNGGAGGSSPLTNNKVVS